MKSDYEATRLFKSLVEGQPPRLALRLTRVLHGQHLWTPCSLMDFQGTLDSQVQISGVKGHPHRKCIIS